MGPYNEFAIIHEINTSQDYSKVKIADYNTIKISDDCVNQWVVELSDMDAFWHKLANPKKGLARYGVTLIPPKSLNLLREAILSNVLKRIIKNNCIIDLLELIERAETENKCLIHFGI